jgi:uncharacterized protein (TIGR03437 family)
MCLRDTDARFRSVNARRVRWVFALTAGIASCAAAQTSKPWTRVAGTTVNDGLAGAASGPVAAIWYTAGTRRLLVETAAGRVFETADFVHWRLNTDPRDPAAAVQNSGLGGTAALPEAGAKVQAAGARLYAVGPSNLYASDDSGRTWLNLTGYNNRSVIGDGFTGLATAPENPQEISATNRFGVWRSLDGGLSWRSLNEDLPNLTVRKLIDRRTALLADGTVAQVQMGAWTPVEGVDPEVALRARFGGMTSAAVLSGATAYAGTTDGRLLVSRDSGANWDEARRVAADSVARIWVDADRPDVAVAAAGAHLYRTINGGLFWDEVTGALQAGAIHGIAADRSAGVVYAATDRGLFSGSLSLNDAGAAATGWKAVARDLPDAPAWDVRLNPDNTMTVALDGYGVFEAPAPHQTRSVRIVSGADLSDRPAAPGSLISVLGAKVETVGNQAGNPGVSYPVLASSQENSQLQVPFEATAGTFLLSLENSTDRWSVPLTVREASPAIFVDAEGAPLILEAASGLVVDPKLAVYAGSTVQILATGLGKVKPEWPTGVPAPADSPPVVSGTVTAFLDGRPLEVERAVLAPGYVGYYLVELQIPAIVNRGASELRIVMNGAESNRVKLYLEPNLPDGR